jgi:hypothetical protein
VDSVEAVGGSVVTDQLAMTFDASIAERFEEFHKTNPHVYRTLVRLAREWVNSTGRHKLGIKSLFEVARWQLAIETSDPDYKLNNNYTAFYARLIHVQEPDLDGLFNVRASEADAWLNGRVA